MAKRYYTVRRFYNTGEVYKYRLFIQDDLEFAVSVFEDMLARTKDNNWDGTTRMELKHGNKVVCASQLDFTSPV